MKRVAIIVALVAAAMLIVADMAVAQDRPAREGRTREGRAAREGRAGGAGNRVSRRGGRQTPQMQYDKFTKAISELGLTGETKEKVDKITAEYAKKMAEQKKAEDEARAKMAEKMKEARESGNREAMTEMRTKSRELAAKGAETVKAYEAAVTALLNDEQKAKLAELTLPPIPARAVLAACTSGAEELKLTDEQKASIKTVAEKYAPKEGEENPGRAMMEKMREIRNSDKTDEEKREAMTKMREEMQKAGEAAQKRDRECLAEVDKVLNKEQQKQVRAMARKQMQERRTTRRRQGDGGNATGGGERRGRRNRDGEDAPKRGSSAAPKPDGVLK